MGKKIARIIGRVLLVVLVTIVMLVGTLFIMIKRICSDSAPAARNLFISTVLESGQMKFLASWFCTDAQINEVINANKMESMDSDIDTSLINISSDTDTQTVDNNGEVEQFDGNGIRMVEISGRSFFGKMLIIKDPSQVKVGTTYPWGDYGKELHEIEAEQELLQELTEVCMFHQETEAAHHLELWCRTVRLHITVLQHFQVFT